MSAADESPDVFRATPVKGSTGVRRLNRLPLLAGFGLLVLVGGVVMYTVIERGDTGGFARSKAPAKVDPATAMGVLDDAPAAGLIEAREPPAPAPEVRAPIAPPPLAPVAVARGRASAAPIDAQTYGAEWQAWRQQEQQARQMRQQSAMAALQASPAVTGFGQGAGRGAGGVQGDGQGGGLADAGLGALAGRLDRMSELAAAAAGGAGGTEDENRATEKAAWLDSPPDAKGYLPEGKKPLLSPFEVKAGTVIPGVMIGGINSDLPSQIVGQVAENVWDTATGTHLLIPQGSRLLGTYSNQVTRGQSRVLVAWQRIIYPDGASLDLGGMPGTDQAGFAGFRDKVNNHYRRVFGDALLMSLFAAGIQLSQPDSRGSDGGYDSQQIVAASVGQQLGQAGMQITQRNTNIQPTLEVRPGYRFQVMVTRDFVVSPWRG